MGYVFIKLEINMELLEVLSKKEEIDTIIEDIRYHDNVWKTLLMKDSTIIKIIDGERNKYIHYDSFEDYINGEGINIDEICIQEYTDIRKINLSVVNKLYDGILPSIGEMDDIVEICSLTTDCQDIYAELYLEGFN